MFSATMRAPILELGKRFLRDPEMLSIAHRMLTVPAIEQTYYEVRPYQKMDALCRVLDSQGFRKALVFCSTKRGVDDVTAHLQGRGYQSDGLHGNLAQPQRDRVMNRFRSGGLEILVATDVAARGIDIPALSHVFLYEPPEDHESYIHRAGRTGRAGAAGTVISLVDIMQRMELERIARHYKIALREIPAPTDEDVAVVAGARVTTLLESRFRKLTGLEKMRVARYAPLVRELASQAEDDENGLLLAMLVDAAYQESLGHVQQLPEGRSESSRRGDGEGRGRKRSSRRRRDRGDKAAEAAAPAAEAVADAAPAADGGDAPAPAEGEGTAKRRRRRRRRKPAAEGQAEA